MSPATPNAPVRIGLVHALYASIAPMESALAETWPAAEPVSLYDRSLYLDFAAAGRTTPAIAGRIGELLRLSADSGTRGIVFTGSLFGEAVASAAAVLDIPVLGAYDALIDEGLASGPRLVLLTTLDSTARLLVADLRRIATSRGVEPGIDVRVVDGAFAALQAGDSTRHDQLVAQAIADCHGPADAILLGQYSMSPALARVTATPVARVISGPHAAARALKARLS